MSVSLPFKSQKTVCCIYVAFQLSKETFVIFLFLNLYNASSINESNTFSKLELQIDGLLGDITGCKMFIYSLFFNTFLLQYQIILVRVTMDLEPILRTLGIGTDSERVTGHYAHTFTHSFIPRDYKDQT